MFEKISAFEPLDDEVDNPRARQVLLRLDQYLGQLGYLQWQPTPLDPYSERSRLYLAEVESMMHSLIENPPARYQGRGFEEAVQIDLLAGMANRSLKTAANYQHWLQHHPDESAQLMRDPDLKWALGESLTGHGTPRGRIELMRMAASLRSLDLDSLMMPFGYRREYLAPMFGQLYDDLVGAGAEFLDIDPMAPSVSLHISFLPNACKDKDVVKALSAHGKGAPAPAEFGSAQIKSGLVVAKWDIAKIRDLSGPGDEVAVTLRRSWLVPVDVPSRQLTAVRELVWMDPKWEESPTDRDFVHETMLTEVNSQSEQVAPLSVTVYAHRSRKVAS